MSVARVSRTRSARGRETAISERASPVSSELQRGTVRPLEASPAASQRRRHGAMHSSPLSLRRASAPPPARATQMLAGPARCRPSPSRATAPPSAPRTDGGGRSRRSPARPPAPRPRAHRPVPLGRRSGCALAARRAGSAATVPAPPHADTTRHVPCARSCPMTSRTVLRALPVRLPRCSSSRKRAPRRRPRCAR